MFLGRLRGSLFLRERWFGTGHAALSSRTTALLSSRIGREFERHHDWFERLNNLLQPSVMADRVLLTCRETTCHRYIKAAATTRRLACIECLLPSRRQTFAQWIASLDANQSSRLRAHLLAVSPPVYDRAQDRRRAARGHLADEVHAREPWPLADRLLATLAQDVYVLFVRPRGNLERLITHHLEHPPPWPQRWLLVDDPRSIPPLLVRCWEARGAIVWNPSTGGRARLPAATDPSRSGVVSIGCQPIACQTPARRGLCRASPVMPLDEVPGERYLAHWTRRQPGPWPDESEADYVESLLVDPQARDRAPLASLLRILRMQRLIATNRLTRSVAKVVCFTACPLVDFLRRRTFRSMHARWDFEPYGVCIDRQWLIHHGARPVIYGDEATWRQMADDDRPFFQHRGTAAGSRGLDWTLEDEWRHVGDIDLSQIPPERVLVFVPDEVSASVVCRVSPWPVTVLGGHA